MRNGFFGEDLAGLGAEQEEDLVVSLDIPISIKEFIIRDSLNITQVLD